MTKYQPGDLVEIKEAWHTWICVVIADNSPTSPEEWQNLDLFVLMDESKSKFVHEFWVFGTLVRGDLASSGANTLLSRLNK